MTKRSSELLAALDPSTDVGNRNRAIVCLMLESGPRLEEITPMSKNGTATEGSILVTLDLTDPFTCESGSVTDGPATFTPLDEETDTDRAPLHVGHSGCLFTR